MNDIISDSFEENARRNTEITVNGVRVNPTEVVVQSESAAGTSPSLQLNIQICSAALYHELSQSGVELPPAGLEDFVRNDLGENPKVALSAYLQIAKGITMPKPPNGILDLFKRRQPAAPAKWSVAQVQKVITKGDSIVICCTAQPIA